MKRSKLLFIVAMIVIFTSVTEMSSAQSTGDSWTSAAPMTTARTDLGVVSLNGKIYAIGGYVYGAAVSTNEMYDPAANNWTPKAPMPTPRAGLALAVFQNKIYAIGGATSINQDGGATSTNVNEVYDTITDTWTAKSPMPTALAFLSANVVNGKIYLIGGGNWANTFTFGPTSLNQVYDPQTDSWTVKSRIPNAVGFYASAVVDDKIYIIGGSQSAGTGWNYNQIYDTKTDGWSSGKPLPGHSQWDGLYGMAAGVVTTILGQSRIFVIGGHDSTNGTYNLNEVYDVSQDNWTAASPMPTPRYELAAVVINGSIYAIGGWSYFNAQHDMPSNINEQYTPSEYSGPISAPSPSAQPTISSSPTPLPSSSVTLAPSASSSPPQNPNSSFSATLSPTPPQNSENSPSPTVPEISGLVAVITLGIFTCAVVIISKRKWIVKRK